MDEGYEILGNYQDLAHSLVDYNSSDAAARLQLCMAWLHRFQQHVGHVDYMAYLQHPSTTELFHRPKAVLSGYFWGYNGTRPDLSYSGLANMARLASSMLARSSEAYEVTVKLSEIISEPHHSTFHRFRKQTRSILAVVDAFPAILPEESLYEPAAQGTAARRALTLSQAAHSSSSRIRDALSALFPRHAVGARGGCVASDVVTDLRRLFQTSGKVNDKVFAYNFYKERGDKAEAERAQQAVAAAWAELVEWMRSQELGEEMACLSWLIASSVAWRKRTA